MLLGKHIGGLLLKDDMMAMAMSEKMHPEAFRAMEGMAKHELSPNNPAMLEDPEMQKMYATWSCLGTKDQKAYWITNTVLDSLEHIKVKRKEGHFDWSMFLHLKDQKLTFLFPNNTCLRMVIRDNVLWFCHLWVDDLDKGTKWFMFKIDRTTGLFAEGTDMVELTKIDKFVYTFLCFFFLSEHEYKELQPNEKSGTRKTGKVINTTKLPVTVVNSTWNVTSIRTEGFGVRGHFATRLTGVGRKIPKLVYIEPFEKKGYVRKAKKETIQ